MKLSVIIGVLHMTLGIILKGVNSFRKKSYLDLFTLVIPQLLFMGSTFIYMDALIIIKWATKYKDTSTAPSIINTLIGMFISNTHKSEFFFGQAALQQFLMVLAILLIPFLLFAKPFVIWISGIKNA
jgi:V-type H+-transporting ATPase subunit a